MNIKLSKIIAKTQRQEVCVFVVGGGRGGREGGARKQNSHLL